METWKDINGYEGYYSISSYGRVKSLERRISCGGAEVCLPEGIRKPIITHGYCYVSLWKNGVGKRHAIHRLVAEAFIPNPDGRPQVNHLDGNKQNNNVHNLEWCTPSENNFHAFETGLSAPYDRRGSRNPMYGRHHSESGKAKIAAVHRGLKHSDEAKAKMSEARKGKPFTEEHKRRISESLKAAKVGSRRVTKDGVIKCAKGEKLQQYLSEGWQYTKRSKR